jgi:hypothetical protein
MGKRFVVNADGWLSPCWFSPNAKGSIGYLKFNYIIEPSIEFAVAKKMAVGVAYLYTPERKFPVRIYANGAVNFQYPQYIIRVPFYFDDENYNNTFKTHGIGLYYKYYFGSNSRAPLGYFIKTEFDCFFYKYEVGAVNLNQYIDKKDLPDDFKDYSNVVYAGEKGKGNIGGFKFEFGRDFLFFNRLRLSTGIGFGITFGGFQINPFNKKDKRKYLYSFNEDEYITSNIVKPTEYINGQLLGMYWFGLRVGLGFLAF